MSFVLYVCMHCIILYDVIHKTRSTQHIATFTKEDQASCAKTLVKLDMLFLRYACGQTDILRDRQTDPQRHFSQYCTPQPPLPNVE